MFHRFNAIVSCAAISLSAFAQGGGLTDMSESKHAVMVNTPIGSVKWTGGFWEIGRASCRERVSSPV